MSIIVLRTTPTSHGASPAYPIVPRAGAGAAGPAPGRPPRRLSPPRRYSYRL